MNIPIHPLSFFCSKSSNHFQNYCENLRKILELQEDVWRFQKDCVILHSAILIAFKIMRMEKNSEKYDITAFEDEGFVKECLDEFDANVAKVEAEYAVTGKSA